MPLIENDIQAVAKINGKMLPVVVTVKIDSIDFEGQHETFTTDQDFINQNQLDEIIKEIWNQILKLPVHDQSIKSKRFSKKIKISIKDKETGDIRPLSIGEIDGDCLLGAIAIGFYADISNNSKIKGLHLLTEKDIINPKSLSDKFKIFNLFENNNQNGIQKGDFSKEYLCKNLNRIIATYNIKEYLKDPGKSDYIINTNEDTFNEINYIENLFNNRAEINKIFKEEIRQLNEKKKLKDVFVIASVDTDKLNEVGELVNKLKAVPNESIVYIACKDKEEDKIRKIEQEKKLRIITIKHINDFVTMLNPEFLYPKEEMKVQKADTTSQDNVIEKTKTQEVIPSQSQKAPKINIKPIAIVLTIFLVLFFSIFAFYKGILNPSPIPDPTPDPTITPSPSLEPGPEPSTLPHKIDSPHGEIPSNAAIISYDGKYIVTQQESQYGIEVQEKGGDKKAIRLVPEGFSRNPLKAMAFSKHRPAELAVVYNYHNRNEVVIVNVENIDSIRIPVYKNPPDGNDYDYHYVDFIGDGNQLLLKGEYQNGSYQKEFTLHISEYQ